jgi:hypothetical protein
VAPNNRGFPSAVMCTKFVRVQQIFTTTIRSQTTTNLPARLIFVTQTSTTTSTSIIVPANLRTTQTLTTTTNTWFVDISVATSTTSVIETKTVTQAVATTYAACNPSNALSIFPDGRYVANIVDDTTDPDISAMAPIEGITNASDCCAACQQRYYDCAASFFISDPSSGLVRCSLFHRDDETCLSQHDGMLNIYGDGTNEGFSISLSNGPCGLYVEKTQQNGKT